MWRHRRFKPIPVANLPNSGISTLRLNGGKIGLVIAAPSVLSLSMNERKQNSHPSLYAMNNTYLRSEPSPVFRFYYHGNSKLL